MERLWPLLLAALVSGCTVIGGLLDPPAPGTGECPSLWCSVLGFALTGHNFSSVAAADHRACWSACRSHPLCLSANYHRTDRCQLNNATHRDYKNDYRPAVGWVYTHSQNQTQKSCSQDPTQGTRTGISTASPVLAPTVIGLLCPWDCGNFTFSASSTVPVYWYSSFRYERLHADGSVSRSTEGGAVCHDDAGAIVQSGDVFPAGTRKNLTCNATDPSGDAQVSCSFGIVVIDCPTCGPLGMESGAIRDDQITAQSSLDGNDNLYGPRLARPNKTGWCADIGGHWIQVDFERIVDIYGAILQSHAVSGTIGSVKIRYSNDGAAWTSITEVNGENGRTFPGPEWSTGRRFISFQSPTFSKIRASHIRITLWRFYWVAQCLRFELIGTRHAVDNGSE